MTRKAGGVEPFCFLTLSLIRHALDWRQMKIESAEAKTEPQKRIEGIEYVFCHLIIESLQDFVKQVYSMFQRPKTYKTK